MLLSPSSSLYERLSAQFASTKDILSNLRSKLFSTFREAAGTSAALSCCCCVAFHRRAVSHALIAQENSSPHLRIPSKHVEHIQAVIDGVLHMAHLPLRTCSWFCAPHMEHGLRLSVDQCSLPGQFCILLLRFVDGFHPDASLEAVPAIRVRPALELSVLRSAAVPLLLVNEVFLGSGLSCQC